MEIKLLMLRRLIAELEFINASAVHDTNRYGEWRCDYNKWRAETEKQASEIIADIEKERCGVENES